MEAINEGRVYRAFAIWKKVAKGGNNMLSLSAVAAGALQAMTGLTGVITHALTLRPVTALLHLYMIFFALLLICVEASKFTNTFGFRQFLRHYFGFTQLCVGRGLFQLFVGTFALCQLHTPIYILTGALLGIVGVVTITIGVYAGRKVSLLHKKLNRMALGNDSVAGTDGRAKLEDVEKLFRVIDNDGDESLSKDEIRFYLNSINLSVTDMELDEMYSHLDTDGEGGVDIDEFYAWFLAKRGGPAWI